MGIDGKPRKLMSEQLSEFYKKFLDDNYNMHKEYNKYVLHMTIIVSYIFHKFTNISVTSV